MPVPRCPVCKRGSAGYLDSEKKIDELSLEEVKTEKDKYEAKLARIRQYITDLKAGTVTPVVLPGRVCQGCGHGWREFQKHQKDLEELTLDEAEATHRATARDFKKLVDRENALTPP